MSFEISIGDLRQLLLLLLLYGIFVGVGVTDLVSSGPITASDIIYLWNHIMELLWELFRRCTGVFVIGGTGGRVGGGEGVERRKMRGVLFDGWIGFTEMWYEINSKHTIKAYYWYLPELYDLSIIIIIIIICLRQWW